MLNAILVMAVAVLPTDSVVGALTPFQQATSTMQQLGQTYTQVSSPVYNSVSQ